MINQPNHNLASKRAKQPFWIGARKDWKNRLAAKQPFLVSITPDDLKTHALLLGSTGSGKTTALVHLIAQCVGTGRSIIVFDFRGALANSTFQLACLRVPAEKIALLDLREKLPLVGFNPLAGAGDPYFRALSVIDAVAEESDSWGVQLSETMRYALLLLAGKGQPITNLERVLYDAEYREGLLKYFNDEQLTGFWERYGSLSKDRQATLAGPVMNKVSLLFATDGLRKLFSHPQPLDLAKHLNTPGSVLIISLAADELSGAGRMVGNIILNAIRREIFARITIPEQKRNPVQLIVDEFEHFDSSVFEDFLAEARQYRLALVVAHQTLIQTNPKFRSVVLNNVGLKMFFRTGREDGVLLSKDLTGDAKAIDFNNVPVGEAYLWKKEKGFEPVLVNAPLLKPSLIRTLASYLVKERMRREARAIFNPKPDEGSSSAPAPTTPKRPKAPAAKNLEEWL
jgi:hypothetical protein